MNLPNLAAFKTIEAIPGRTLTMVIAHADYLPQDDQYELCAYLGDPKDNLFVDSIYYPSRDAALSAARRVLVNFDGAGAADVDCVSYGFRILRVEKRDGVRMHLDMDYGDLS